MDGTEYHDQFGDLYHLVMYVLRELYADLVGGHAVHTCRLFDGVLNAGRYIQ